MNLFVRKITKSTFAIVLFLVTVNCAAGTAAPELPKDVLGVGIGMSKQSAETRLREIAKFVRKEGEREQIWLLNNNPNFGYVTLGYDEENQVQYVSALVTPQNSKPVFFKDVGDLTKAKKEVAGPNHWYIWEIAAKDNNPAYTVKIYGNNAETLSSYTLIEPNYTGQKEDKEEDKEKDKEDDRK